MSSTATGVVRGELPPPALQRAQAGYVIGELEGTRFGLDLSSADASGNHAVFSTIDPRVQALAQQQLQRFQEGLAAAVELTQGALITLSTESGEILAYVGGCSHGACSPGGSASVIDGLALSENVVALRLAERAGLGAGGEAGPPARHLHTDGGRSVPMHGVSRIDDLGVCQSIKSLDRCPEQGVTVPIGEQPRQLLSPEVAAAADQMLAAVLQRGTG